MKGHVEVQRVEIKADIIARARGALAMFGIPVPEDVSGILDALPKTGDLLLVVYQKVSKA